MHFNPKERLAVFIEGPRLNAELDSLRLQLDFRRLLRLFQSQALLQRAYFYTLVPQDGASGQLRRLLDWLAYHHYEVVEVPLRESQGSPGRLSRKSPLGVPMSVGAMALAPHVEHIVLVSGSADFTPLVQTLKATGKRVTVVSSLKAEPPVDGSLRRHADQFIDLDDIRDLIVLDER